MSAYSVLIADDDASIRKLLERICLDLEWTVDLAANGDEALNLLEDKRHQIFIVDVKMPGLSGIELARKILECEAAPAILILTGYAEVKQAVQAMKEGVFNYVQKDAVAIDDIRNMLLRAAEYHENRVRNIQSQRERETVVRNIAAANKRFQAVLELTDDMIFIVNGRTGRIEDCNQSAYTQFGYTRKDLLELHLHDIDHDLSPDNWEEFVEELRTKRHIVTERSFREKVGNSYEVSFAYICLETGEYLVAIARDITERKRAEEEIEQAQLRLETQAAKLQLMIEGMEEGVIFADSSDVITEVNTWVTDFAKTPKEFVLGQKLEGVIKKIFGLSISPAIEKFRHGDFQDKINFQEEISGIKILLSLQPIFQNDCYQGVVLNISDITELMSASEKIEEESRYQSDFLNKTSKEMRTPLSGILEMTDQVLNTNLNDDQRLLLEIVKDCGNSLDRLVSDFETREKSES